ncbi:MAG: sigma-70 family RNA polymerase sigma factor, partial [Dehalococcoidia bacterium]|nr:sigma-70 family RNA polymerase sigma factor [Dehalococcoidia bacterium]
MVLAHRSPLADLDGILVRRARSGDRDAFATLMEEYSDVVSRLVRRFVHDADDARDVEQDTWIRAATRLDSLKDESRFRPWLKAIARNSSLTFLSSHKREHHRVSTFDDYGTDEFEDQQGLTPEGALLSKESQRKVWQVLGSLSERDRTALYLREYKDQPYEEIAQTLSISRNAAEVCVFRARERFRRVFAEVDSFQAECGVDGLRLSMLLDGEASTTARSELETHLRACDCCRERLQTMAAGQALYRNLGALGIPIGPGFGLLARLGDLFARISSLFGGGAEAGAGAGAAAIGGAASAIGAGTGAGAITAAGIGAGTMAVVAGATAAAVISVGAILAPAVTHAQPAPPPATVAAAGAPSGTGPTLISNPTTAGAAQTAPAGAVAGATSVDAPGTEGSPTSALAGAAGPASAPPVLVAAGAPSAPGQSAAPTPARTAAPTPVPTESGSSAQSSEPPEGDGGSGAGTVEGSGPGDPPAPPDGGGSTGGSTLGGGTTTMVSVAPTGPGNSSMARANAPGQQAKAGGAAPDGPGNSAAAHANAPGQSKAAGSGASEGPGNSAAAHANAPGQASGNANGNGGGNGASAGPGNSAAAQSNAPGQANGGGNDASAGPGNSAAAQSNAPGQANGGGN